MNEFTKILILYFLDKYNIYFNLITNDAFK